MAWYLVKYRDKFKLTFTQGQLLKVIRSCMTVIFWLEDSKR